MLPLRFVRNVTVAATFSILTACMVGPNYVKPRVVTPVAFKEVAGWKAAEPQDHLPRGPWWEMFNDPQLNALEEQIDISNQNVATAEAQYRQALAAVKISRAAFWPTVAAGTQASDTRASSSLGSGSRFGGPIGHSITDYQFSGSTSWEPDIWGKVRRQVEASKASAQVSAADLEGVKLSARALLAQDYFQLRTLDAQKQILDNSVASYQKFLDLTRNRYAAGVASRSDVLQAETQLKTTQAQSVDTRVQRQQFEHAIAMLMGKPPSEFSIPFSPLVTIPPNVPTGVPSELLERRPDIAAAERQAAAANAQIGVAKAAYYPNITLDATGGFEATHLTELFTWPSRMWTLGPAVIQETLFDGGLRRGQVEQAIAGYDANVASYRQAVLSAFQQVEDNLSTLRFLEQEQQVQDEAMRAAKDSLQVTLNRYYAGTASSLDVIVTENIALTNEVTDMILQGRRMTATVLLVQSLGGGWTASEIASAADK